MPRVLPNSAHRARRIVASLLLAWLNLGMQIALAAAPVIPAGMADCHHAGDCPEMRAAACATTGDAAIVAQRPAKDTAAHAPLVALLPPDVAAGGQPAMPVQRHGHPPGAGPPLVILFGHLRN